MTSPIDSGENTAPTEEIFLTLQDLQSLAEDMREGANPESPVVDARGDDGPSSIPARIARLRALLRDRGVADRA